MRPDLLSLGMIWYVVFLFSTTCHEGAHAVAAKLGGDPTASQGGQASLNPLPHIRRSPFGMVVVPILSYLLAQWMIGWASAPYSPAWQRRFPRRAAWMALAGPAANFTLMLVAGIAIRVGVALGHFHAPTSATFTRVTESSDPGISGMLAVVLSVCFVLNLLLGTFNLIPVPPLDGSTGIVLMMGEDTALKYLEWSRRGLGFAGLALAWVLFDKIFPALFALALNLLYPGAHYG